MTRARGFSFLCTFRPSLRITGRRGAKHMIRRTLALIFFGLAASAFAAPPAPATATATTTVTAAVDADSRQTREEMKSLLRRYPPELGYVLKLDPTLFGNQAYLANYPAMANFVAQHPEVAHNPSYFLDEITLPNERSEPDLPSMRMWRQIVGDIFGGIAFLVVTAVLIWIIKTLVDQRRWNRLSRVQTEVHSKLLERFTSNDELLAYMQTPAGKRFFESAPIALEAGPRPMRAPIGRIFWSLQAGLVLIAMGIGFDLVSLRVKAEASEALYGLGMISLLVGIALVLSAGVFYLLSRRFGLWQPPAANES
jgi:hypothetical protein